RQRVPTQSLVLDLFKQLSQSPVRKSLQREFELPNDQLLRAETFENGIDFLFAADPELPASEHCPGNLTCRPVSPTLPQNCRIFRGQPHRAAHRNRQQVAEEKDEGQAPRSAPWAQFP